MANVINGCLRASHQQNPIKHFRCRLAMFPVRDNSVYHAGVWRRHFLDATQPAREPLDCSALVSDMDDVLEVFTRF